MRTWHPIHDVSPGNRNAQRHAGSNALRDADNIRLNAAMLDSPPLAGAAYARLHFISNQQNSVPVANTTQLLHEITRRHNVSAFTLNRLDENCRHLLRGQSRLEKFVFDEASTSKRILFALTINVGK